MDDLTLEKIRVAERLQSLEDSVKHLDDNMGLMIGEVRNYAIKHDAVLYGRNGEAGVITRVDRLEQSEVSRKIQAKAIWGGIITVGSTLIGKILHDWVRK